MWKTPLGMVLIALVAVSGIFLFAQPQEMESIPVQPIEQKDYPIKSPYTKCLEDYKFDLSLHREILDEETQIACALLVLEQTEPIVPTGTHVGDISISFIKKIVTHPVRVDNKDWPRIKDTCTDTSFMSNAHWYGCTEETEREFQKALRGLIKYQIESTQQYWKDWYIASILDGNKKDIDCDIEATVIFSGSGYDHVRSRCYTKAAAQEILDLLEM